jgi:hypothetical protein
MHTLVIYQHSISVQDNVNFMKKSINYVLGNNGLLYYKNKLFIHDTLNIKNMIIKDSHEIPIVGHYGFFKTYVLDKKNLFWSKMKKEIQKYVQK